MLRYNLRYQLFLATSDVLLVMLALALSSLLRINIDLGAEGIREAFITPPLLYPIAAALWLFTFGQARVYAAHSGLSLGRMLRRVFTGHALACLLFLGALYITYRDFSRLQAIYFMVLVLVGVVLHRLALLPVRKRLQRYLNTQRTVLIVGVSESAHRIGAMIALNHDTGLNLAGYVRASDDDADPTGRTHPEEQVLGVVDDLPQIVMRHHVDEVVVALKWFDQQASQLVTRVMHLLERDPVNIRIAPDYSELAYFRATPEDFNGVTLVGLREAVLSPVERIFKRVFDIAFSLVVLLLTWPVFAIIAIAIRLDSPGPIVFRQLRIGQHGRRFIIYKFRSMHLNADRIINREEAARFVKRPDDPRVTRVGAFLRRTSLDELPQFINVLKGDMSVVGPRPEVTWLAEQYEWWQRKRFEVPQGITGWWQVNGRSDKPMRLNIEDDLFYVRNYSIWLDLQIIVRTVISWITGKGAY
jgi:exopolysaccharide biosynthesis polyprenyl glycosylphosphotransferase